MKTAICAIIKDEQFYLDEWINFHLSVGFDDIHLYEDFGSKCHLEITSKYELVHLHKPSESEELIEILSIVGSRRQTVLYDYFAVNNKNKYDWVAFIDLDEFIMFADPYNLHSFLEEYKDETSVLLSWKPMGASGLLKKPDGVVNNFTKQANFLEVDYKWSYKSIVNLSLYKGMNTLHEATNSVNTNRNKSKTELLYDKAWINHYFTKSWEEWCTRIFNRGGTLKGHRTIDDFFIANPDMIPLKKELMESILDMKPFDSMWIDKRNKIMVGGNINLINRLNNKISTVDKLVLECGANDIKQTSYFLDNNYNVISIDANSKVCNEYKNHYKREISNGKLKVSNLAISSNVGPLDFYISEKSEWSSVHQKIANRDNTNITKVSVESNTLSNVINKLGTKVFYLKLDIEGNDLEALESLLNIEPKLLPEYVSCETECLGDNEDMSDEEILATLNILNKLGYSKFKLIEQSNNTLVSFDFNINGTVYDFNSAIYDNNWIDYTTAKKLILNHRVNHFNNNAIKYSFWNDWIAKK